MSLRMHFLFHNLTCRSPSPSPLRWADVRLAGGAVAAKPCDTPSPKATNGASPWTGMMDALRRSPSPLKVSTLTWTVREPSCHRQ